MLCSEVVSLVKSKLTPVNFCLALMLSMGLVLDLIVALDPVLCGGFPRELSVGVGLVSRAR